MARRRDYAKEYRRRLRSGLKRGLTPQQARGFHPSEKPARRVPRRAFAARVLGAGHIVHRKHSDGQDVYNLSGRTRGVQRRDFDRYIAPRIRSLRKRGYVVYRSAWLLPPGEYKKGVVSSGYHRTARSADSLIDELRREIDERNVVGFFFA